LPKTPASIAYLLLRGSIAEELAQVSLVISNAMAFDPSDEIVLGVAAESRDAEVRIFRQEVGWRQHRLR
jgi:hypothetical protein